MCADGGAGGDGGTQRGGHRRADWSGAQQIVHQQFLQLPAGQL